MTTDPFAIKSKSKWHLQRLWFTARARLLEKEAQFNFEKYKLPLKEIPIDNASFNGLLITVSWQETAVTLAQMHCLLGALNQVKSLDDACVVEIGCCRGITTEILAKFTTQTVIGVDPFIGYGGFEDDYNAFLKRTKDLNNVQHIKKTSGEAASLWKTRNIGFLFIDAVHDYVNTQFDLSTWIQFTVPGSFIALHDTDLKNFAGTRKAAHEALLVNKYNLDLYCHVDNLIIFRVF
jgi:hypothetical protein